MFLLWRRTLSCTPCLDILGDALPFMPGEKGKQRIELENLLWCLIAQNLCILLVGKEGFQVPMDDNPLDGALNQVTKPRLAGA